MIPPIRVRARTDHPVRSAADGARYVLYWMTAARRTSWSFALDHAIHHARALSLPLVVLEPLRAGYRWASDRHHAFVIQGMEHNARVFADAGVTYVPWIEPAPGAGRGLLRAFAAHAAIVIGDDWPSFFHPRMTAAAARVLDELGVRFEDVDGNGLLPLRAAGAQVFPTAYAFRRFLQATLPAHLAERPSSSPLSSLPRSQREVDVDDILRRFPSAPVTSSAEALQALPIDHAVPPIAVRGGEMSARMRLRAFLDEKLSRYATDRSTPDKDGQSGLSPFLHWGHVSTHEIVDGVWRREGFSPERVGASRAGAREGWWGLSASAEAFLDELITWRELGFNMTSRRADAGQWSSLPTWAQETLLQHAADRRDHVYSLDELENARTHDPLWNAAQRQLRAEGIIHNYLRMLWGKKVLEWSAHPQEALQRLLHLNDRWAIDGRDPNSLSGIFWVFGRYDRPWGPVRPIFGSVRYMTSENTARKHDVDGYLARWNGATAPPAPLRRTAKASQSSLW